MECENDSLNADCNGSSENMASAGNLPQTDGTHNCSVSNSCRLCLVEQKELQMDIFMKPLDENHLESSCLADRLYDLLHVKFENKSPLPRGICERCLMLFEALSQFRENILKCEAELQQRFNELHMKYRESAEITGLNGNPGEFIAEADCEIIEVNVEQDYESSEDDFSMESDSESENHEQAANTTSSAANNVTQTENMLPLATTINHFPKMTQNLENAMIKTLCYLCQYCDVAFTTQTECYEHEAKAHDQIFPYICNFCQAQHISRQSIIAHIRQAHQPDRPYICPLCSKGFCRRSDLKKHAIVHTGVRPYTCTICSKSFSRNTNLSKHLRIHNSSRPYCCQKCPRSFVNAQELSQHAMTHSETKSYQCDQCSITFTRRDKLNTHRLTHIRHEANLVNQATAPEASAEFPYQQHKSILATHLLHQQPQSTAVARSTSNKSRCFTCDSCPKTFTRDQDLQRHRALHLDNLFKCRSCDAGFSRKEKLMKHIQEHHSAIYNCDFCNISFSQAESLNMHMKIHQLQQYASYSAISALNVVNNNLNVNNSIPTNHELIPPKQLTTEEMSFYSQMVPTMNLGFYSETRPEA